MTYPRFFLQANKIDQKGYAMYCDKNNRKNELFLQENASISVLDKIIQEGARKILQEALENEIEELIQKFKNHRDDNGKAMITRNGYMPERDFITGVGALKIKRPRVDDRKLKDNPDYERFTSKILPRFMRRSPSIDNLIPTLYLKGISTNDFSTALSSILGDSAKGLSASNIVRLKASWEEDYKKWSKRELSEKKYVYFWVDGIYFNVRLDDEKTCILVIMGADKNGNKELIAVTDGYRESKIGWKELLLDIRKRGLKIDPKLVIGDGGLGFWSAAREVYGTSTKEQRCWVHKTANILDKMPKSIQSKAKSMIHEMYMAETKKNALRTYDHFIEIFESKYPKAVNCLKKDKNNLFTFYDFPAEHWQHIRSTNPIESTFATIRLRSKKTKGCGSRIATLTMVFKLAKEAEKRWRKLKGYKQIPLVIQGITFVDGIMKEAA